MFFKFNLFIILQHKKSKYCQAQPKSKFSLAELAIKLDSDTNNTNNNRGSIKQTEYQQQELFKGF